MAVESAVRIMIAGGGTGGHTSPAVAIIEEIRKTAPGTNFEWAGRAGSIEERVSRSLGIPFRSLPVEGWPRRKSLRRVWVLAKLAFSMVKSAWYIARFWPDAALGVGGYVSLPLLWMAQRMGVPTVLHEQNRLLGKANRVLAARAHRLFLSFPNTTGVSLAYRTELAGNPVRTAFANPPSQRDARLRFGLDVDIPVVFVCGGSQGAQTLNHAMAGVIRAFARQEAQFIWMTGPSGLADAEQALPGAACNVRVFGFVDDMPAACAAADLVVSRAGASTTAELAMLGKPSILVPFPHATDNHQEQNARAFEEIRAAVMLLDKDCREESLTSLLRELLRDPERLGAMGAAARSLAHPEAARTVADELIAMARGGKQ